MSESEHRAAAASLEARAALAERSGLPRTAQSWRERAANLPRPAVARDMMVYEFSYEFRFQVQVAGYSVS